MSSGHERRGAGPTAIGSVLIGCILLAGPGCDDGGPAPVPGEPRLQLGVAAGVLGQDFAPLPAGGAIRFADSGQAALLARLGLRAWNMGSALAGELSLTDQASGRVLRQEWQRLLLYCNDRGGYCEQVPVYMSLAELGLPGEVDGMRVRVQGQFRGLMGQGPLPIDTTAVLRRQ